MSMKMQAIAIVNVEVRCRNTYVIKKIKYVKENKNSVDNFMVCKVYWNFLSVATVQNMNKN